MNNNGEIKLGDFLVYLSSKEPRRQSYFVLSEEITGFGAICEKKDCEKDCRNCSGELRIETAELVYGKEAFKALKLSSQTEGKFWLWFGPNLRKLCRTDSYFCLEVLAKEEIKGYVVILQLVISESNELLGSFNITENLKQRNKWNCIEVPFGVGGFELNWFKISKPGTLTLEIKLLPLEKAKQSIATLYLKTLTIK